MHDSFDGLAYVSSTLYRLKNESGEPADAHGYRNFTADDEIEGRHRVAILSHSFWQRRLAGRHREDDPAQ